MTKNIILIGALFSSTYLFSQVGIDTETPKVTLDVRGKSTDVNVADGIIAPRLTGNELKAKDSQYANDQIGAIVYATEAVTTTSAKTVNVTNAGYYYFDGSVWVAMKASTVAIYQEPWNVSGTTTPATANNQDIYQLGKVGIGINAPAQVFHVNTASTGSNNVPVLVTAPNMAVGDNLYLKIGKADSGSSNLADIKYTYQNSTNLSSLGFGFSGGSSRMTLLGNGNLGLSTTFPTNRLHVVSSSDPIKLEGLQTVTSYDKIIVADASGVLKTATSSSVTLEPWYNSATSSAATSNTQNIYQMGKVSVGKNAVYTSGNNSVQLDAQGSVRFGSSQAGGIGTNSFASGTNNESSGDNSSTLGKNNKVTGSASFASGDSNTVSGDNSLAVGNKVTVTGNNAIGFGVNTEVGNYGFAANDGSKATGRASVALTREAIASGENSVAIGYGANASGSNSVAIGLNTTAVSQNSYSFGANLIGGSSSVTPGGVVTLGKNNLAPNNANAVLVVGGGADSGSRSNLLVSYGYGNTGGPWTTIHPGTTLVRRNVQVNNTNYLMDIQLNGNTWASAFFTDTSRYPDYVFEDYFDGKSEIHPEYKFKNIYETEKFILENKHLPGVTSINQLNKDENGKVSFDLTNLSLQSLEKIEELYLHTIEQQKQIDAQQKQIDLLIDLTNQLKAKLDVLN